MAKAGKTLPGKKKKQTREEREELLKEARELLKHWMRFRDYLLMGFQDTPITPEQEQAFLELKSRTARSQRVVAQKMPENLKFGEDKITDLLRQAISIAHIRGLPVADKRGLIGAWHVASVMLHRAVGALEYINETREEMREKKHRIGGVRAIKSEAAAVKKKSKVPMVIGALVVIAAAVGLYFLLFGTA